MTSPYKKVLMIGGSTGIGKGMSSKLIATGATVIVTSRTESTLKSFVAEHPDKSSYKVFDLANLDSIQPFIEKTFKEHPDIDCVWLNAGVQFPANPVAGTPSPLPEGTTMDVGKVDLESRVNYTGQVAVSQAVLPYLQKKEGSAIIYTSSILAYLPFPMVATYSATKAATHFYTMSLREQLKRAKSPCLVAEVYPPVVQTELHGPHGRHMGMPLDEFVEKCWPGITGKHEHWVVGKAIAPDGFFEDVEMKRIQTLTSALDSFAPK